MRKNSQLFYLTLLVLFAANIFIWRAVAFSVDSKQTQLDFLNIGQGDSELVILPGNVKILIDGGPPNGMVLDELSKILPPFDRYIDLLVFSHPHFDHYAGLIDVLRSYRVGAVIDNGSELSTKVYESIADLVEKNGARRVILVQGDAIKYGDAEFDIISPNTKNLASPTVDDGSLVMLLKEGKLRALYTGDIGKNIEDELIKEYDISAQVLKVGHHGSRFSSSPEFLAAVKPKISVIEVGLHNTYGHPTKQVLGNLADVGAQIFRTDHDGTVRVIFDGEKLKVYN